MGVGLPRRVGLQLTLPPGTAGLMAPTTAVHRRILHTIELIRPDQAPGCRRTPQECNLNPVDLCVVDLIDETKIELSIGHRGGEAHVVGMIASGSLNDVDVGCLYHAFRADVEDALAWSREPCLREIQIDHVGGRRGHLDDVPTHAPAVVLVDALTAGTIDACVGDRRPSAQVSAVALPPMAASVDKRRRPCDDARHPGRERPTGRAPHR